MKSSSKFRAGRHVVWDIKAHLVFVPKYRKGVISPRVFGVLRTAWEAICPGFGCTILDAGYEDDHVHLIVSYPPKVALSSLVNSLKGVSSRRLRAEHIPEVEGKMWGEHFWSPSYFVASCGGAPLELIKSYVEKQRGKRGSSPP